MIRRLIVLVLIVVGCVRAQDTPRLIAMNPSKLTAAREEYRSGTGVYAEGVKKLLKESDKALKQDPLSVTTKKQIPPSGDKHDYMSLAPYWWPDPASKNGLPYIRRDGETNPERNEFPDRDAFGELRENVMKLALGYWFSGSEQYAAHAAVLIRGWFLDSTTRMNPNMNFAEAVKGRNDGRGSGIIEIHSLPGILDAVRLIQHSRSWSPEDDKGFGDWCRSYIHWLRTSRNGVDEQDAPNNHGMWYDVQLSALELFAGSKDSARTVLNRAKMLRIASQIEPDGRQPKELERTRAMSYTTFNLMAMTTLATIGANAGVDLWHFRTPDGRSIRTAIDWMVPYYVGTKRWEYQQIIDWKPDDAVTMLTAAGSYIDPSYHEVAAKISKSESALLRVRLMY